MNSENIGPFYVVATPIGNLEDLSPRARSVLESADIILAEDTRIAEQLLLASGIKKSSRTHASQKMYRFDQFKEEEQKVMAQVMDQLLNGKSVALISDAGTPGISDPGSKCVTQLHEDGRFQIIPIPGPSALTTFISAVGIEGTSVAFHGFLPKDSSKKIKLFRDFFECFKNEGLSKKKENYFYKIPAQIFFESPERLGSTLENLKFCIEEQNLQGSSVALPFPLRIALGKELTKKFERFLVGSFEEVFTKWQALSERERKGEWVLLLEFRHSMNVSTENKIQENLQENSPNYREALKCLKYSGVSFSDAVKSICHVFGANRNEVYREGIKFFNTD